MRKVFLSATISFLTLLALVSTSHAVRHTTNIPTGVPPTGTGSSEIGMKQACEAIESSIKTRNDAVVRLVETILEKFDNISQRVQEYYTTKLVPEGYAVDNYDELLAEIDTKREGVLTALDAAKMAASDFDCDLSNPKQTLMQFKEEMLAVLDSLQEYRLAIKDLIVAVNTVVAQDEGAL